MDSAQDKPVKNVTVSWSGSKVAFDIESERLVDHPVRADEPLPQGDDSGLMPTELLLGALGACTGMSAMLLLKKFKQPLANLAVHVRGEQEPTWPMRFTAIQVEFDIEFTGPADDALVDRALDMAVNKYCPIHATLATGVPISHVRRQSPGPNRSTAQAH